MPKPSLSSSASNLPDYYAILRIPSNAAFADILKSYQRLALQLHPELHPDDQATSAAYHQLNQAYFILSDNERRRQYDQSRKQNQSTSSNSSSSSSNNSSALSTLLFPNAAEHMDFFDTVFADLIEQEVLIDQRSTATSTSIWRSLGTISGATLGFIFANLPGAALGAVAGFKAGQVRDHTGKSVLDVWKNMNADKRRSILNKLVQRILY